MNILKKLLIMTAGLGISGLIGAVSCVLLIYVLIDAAIDLSYELFFLYLCASVGVIVGGICFRFILWAGKSNNVLQ